MTERFRTSSPDPSAHEAAGEASLSQPARDDAGAPFFSAMPFFWPLQFARAFGDTAATAMQWYAGLLADAAAPEVDIPEPGWTTANRVALELPTLKLRDFSQGASGQPTLICAPYALHGATIADFAPGHSIIEALRQNGIANLAVTEWRSCTPQMQDFTIDNYLADLNVVVDELKAPVDLIGLCQGGWMALIYAARFPDKVRRLVLAGAPIDVRAARSPLMDRVDALPLAAFENLVQMGKGRVLGRYALRLWGSPAIARDPAHVLQLARGRENDRYAALKQRFNEWHAWTLDLPGAYYLQVVQEVFKENRIAEGRFVALGRSIDPGTVDVPMYLLAGSDDEVIAPEQLFAVTRLARTRPQCIETETAPCGHLGLFMGADTIARSWPRVAQWLSRDLDLALAS